MVKLILGEMGKGKTKLLLEEVNKHSKKADGNIIYLDKSSKHMYELSNKIRLINMKDYLIDNTDSFIGFISGILSGNHDIETIYIDSFLKVAHTDENFLSQVLSKLDQLSEQFSVDFVLSISISENNLSKDISPQILYSL